MSLVAILAKISALQKTPNPSADLPFLREVLVDGPGIAVAKAAEAIAGAACGGDYDEEEDTWSTASRSLPPEWEAFFPDLLNAFQLCCDKPDSFDKGALGKKALASALDRMGYDRPAPFLRGLTYQQIESNFDRAALLRSRCLAALMRLRHSERWLFLTNQLWDNWEEARIGAVRAALYEGGEIAETLLRAKALAGDKGSDFTSDASDGGHRVLGTVFAALLAMRGEKDVPLVAGFMNAAGQSVKTREQAALALGESRLPGALAALTTAWQDAWKEGDAAERKERALYGVALHGTDEAMQVLRGWVKGANPQDRRLLLRVTAELFGEESRRYRDLFSGTGN